MQQYWKAEEKGYATSVYVREESLPRAQALMEIFIRTHPVPEKLPLKQVSWFEGWCKFKGTPRDHLVVWEEFSNDFYQRSASRQELFLMALEKEGRPIKIL